MKKRMTKDERKAIIDLVIAKAKEAKTAALEVRLVKDKNYKEWMKLKKEYNALSKQLQEVSRKSNDLSTKLNQDYNCYVSYNNDKISISNNDYQQDNMKRLELENKLVIMGLEGVDAASFIDELVKEYNS